MTINYDYILQLLGQQISSVNTENIKFVLTDEQSFIKDKDKSEEGIYIVVRFNRASTNLGQSVLPVTLTIMGLANEVSKTQAFFNRFIDTYNMKTEGDITQIWLSPEVILNFNNVWDGYRSLFTVSGTIIIGDGTIRLSKLTYKYKNPLYVEGGDEPEYKNEDVPVIGFIDISEASLNSQPYSNTKGRTKSYGSFITNAFSIVTYPNGSLKFMQDIFKWKYDFNNPHQNDEWTLSGTFANCDTSIPESLWKCRSANFSQKIGDIPTIEISFAR